MKAKREDCSQQEQSFPLTAVPKEKKGKYFYVRAVSFGGIFILFLMWLQQYFISPAKREYPRNIFLISPWKDMLWALLMSTHNISFREEIKKISIHELSCWEKCLIITKAYLYNLDPLKPHFYTVKLGFTGVYIIFLISAQKHRLRVLVRTASPRWF